MQPRTTRLRFLQAKKPESFQLFLGRLTFRVQIYGAPVWDGKLWTLWLVPEDNIAYDIKSGRID